MPRPPASCGTEAAYRRHLRRGEEPDGACSEAANAAKRARRDDHARDRVARVTSILDSARRGADSSIDGLDGLDGREKTLTEAAETVRLAIAVTLSTEPAKLAPLLREQREIARELEAIAGGATKELSLADQLAAARARRAANS
jgi:hypothetical protein